MKAAFPSSSIQSGPGGLGGGLYTLFVEVISSITLADFVRLVVDGVAFDLIKLGAHELILRPLLAEQRGLRERNEKDREASDLASIRIIFGDAIVTVDAASRVSQKARNVQSTQPPNSGDSRLGVANRGQVPGHYRHSGRSASVAE